VRARDASAFSPVSLRSKTSALLLLRLVVAIVFRASGYFHWKDPAGIS